MFPEGHKLEKKSKQKDFFLGTHTSFGWDWRRGEKKLHHLTQSLLDSQSVTHIWGRERVELEANATLFKALERKRKWQGVSFLQEDQTIRLCSKIDLFCFSKCRLKKNFLNLSCWVSRRKRVLSFLYKTQVLGPTLSLLLQRAELSLRVSGPFFDNDCVCVCAKKLERSSAPATAAVKIVGAKYYHGTFWRLMEKLLLVVLALSDKLGENNTRTQHWVFLFLAKWKRGQFSGKLFSHIKRTFPLAPLKCSRGD